VPEHPCKWCRADLQLSPKGRCRAHKCANAPSGTPRAGHKKTANRLDILIIQSTDTQSKGLGMKGYRLVANRKSRNKLVVSEKKKKMVGERELIEEILRKTLSIAVRIRS
jgi:hypothetical protein